LFGFISGLYLLAALVVSSKSASDGKDILLVLLFFQDYYKHLFMGYIFFSGLSKSELEQ